MTMIQNMVLSCRATWQRRHFTSSARYHLVERSWAVCHPAGPQRCDVWELKPAHADAAADGRSFGGASMLQPAVGSSMLGTQLGLGIGGDPPRRSIRGKFTSRNRTTAADLPRRGYSDTGDRGKGSLKKRSSKSCKRSRSSKSARAGTTTTMPHIKAVCQWPSQSKSSPSATAAAVAAVESEKSTRTEALTTAFLEVELGRR